MGASRHKLKRCETCIFYKPSDLKGQGWCTHPKRQQSGGMLLLVRAGALDCRNSWGDDFWTPIDGGSDGAVANAAPEQGGPTVTATQTTPAPSVEDLVVRQEAIMNDDLASSHSGYRDDESINHAALSDQEERAHVMARGAREAIQRARERKKAQFAQHRLPQVAPLPSADTEAGEWAPRLGVEREDLVLSTAPQVVDPFKRSYGDPAPPVPSREMPTDATGIVSRDHDDLFDTVPEIQAEVELPRPAHFNAQGNDARSGEPLDADGAALPDDTAQTSYDRVLERAQQFKRRTGVRTPHRTFRPPSAPAALVRQDQADEPAAAAASPAPGPQSVQQYEEDTWEPDGENIEPMAAGADSAADWIDDAEPEEYADVPMPDWDEEADALWLSAAERTERPRPSTRRRFHLPQLSLLRHHGPSRQAANAFAGPDDIVEEMAWNAPVMPGPPAQTGDDDDPDWVEEVVPSESYASAQPDMSPADVSPAAAVESAWDDRDDDEEVQTTGGDVAGYVTFEQPFTNPAMREPDFDDDWDDQEATAAPDDIVSSEATVPHKPQPIPASFDFANLRTRLFAQPGAMDHARPERTATSSGETHGWRDRPRGIARRPAPVIALETPPEEDPDPEPGAGFDAPLPAIEEHWSEPEPEFDLRSVVQRQDELLDMHIQVAPDVPRACRTCRSFRAADGGERGWCTNDWAFSHRRMVNADDLPCESSIGCWWLPADDVWLPADDLTALAQPTPLVDRLLGRLTLPGIYEADDEEPRRARAR